MKRICKKTTTLSILHILDSNIELQLDICEENVSSYINNNNTKMSALGLFLVHGKETYGTDRTSKLMGSNVTQCLFQHFKCDFFQLFLPFPKKIICCSVRQRTGYSYANKRNLASEFLDETLRRVGCNKPANSYGSAQRCLSASSRIFNILINSCANEEKLLTS